jgi:hypothetical protein
MSSARERVAGFWDEHVGAWLAGEDPMADPLPRWFASFQGRGAGRVTREGFPEPYTGDLLGRVGLPRLVVLGLNPGVYHPRFQARDGIFADEIRQYGSYGAWMATGPYFRPPWTTERTQPLLLVKAALRTTLVGRPDRNPGGPADL